MKISEKALDHPKSTLFIAFTLFVVSCISYITLPVELVPEIKIPYALVSATYTGAAPSEIENEIIKPIEEKLALLRGTEEIVGYALQNVGFFSVKYSPDFDRKESIDDLKEKVNEALPELSDKVENVTVHEILFEDEPISILNIYGNFQPYVLRQEAKRIKDQIKRVSGVNDVEMFGGLEREVTIQLNPDLLLVNNLSVAHVIATLQRNNLNYPGGTIKLENQDVFVRTIGKYTSIKEIENTILSVDEEGNVKRIRDVGYVVDGFEEPKSYSRYNQMNSVTILISKQMGAHIVETTEAIEAVVDKEAKKFPGGMNFSYTARQATETERQNAQLNSNALYGILFVVLVLFAGIGFKNSLIVSLALPFALMFSFPLMHVFGLANTGISMFGLIIVLGIVVDGAIIVAESTYRKMEEGLPRKEAADSAIREVGTPIFTSILTTMVAFAPIMYMSGTMGQFLSVIPKVVIFTLVGAFIADHFLIPVLASKMMSISTRKGLMSGEWIGKRIYTKILKMGLKYRWTSLLLITLVFFSALVIIGVSTTTDIKLVKVQIFPKVPKPRIIVDIKTSPGSQLEYTDSVVKDIEEYLKGYSEVHRFVSTIGESGIQNVRLAQGGGKGAEIAQINVDLTNKQDREKSVEDLIEEMSEDLGKIPGVRITLNTIVEGPPVANNVIIDVSGDNLDELKIVAEKIKEDMSTIEGALNVKSSLGVRRTEFQVVVDHERAALYGLSSQEISNSVATALIGFEATQYTDGLEDIPVRVKIDVSGVKAIDAVRNMNIRNPLGHMIPFENVASLELRSSESLIKHKNFKRNISVSCDLSKGVDAMDIRRHMDPYLSALSIPSGVTVEYGGIEDEASKSFKSLSRAMIIGFMIILIILSAQFKSLKQPFVIALAIPLSFIGVIYGLMITRVAFGIMAFFGVVALMGVVVNDAIVLMAYVNDQRRAGLSVYDSLIKAGRNRLRPIILTTITTMAGMIPLSLNFAGGAEYWRPLAVSLIFGLAVASVLTLVIIPILYSLMEDRK